MKILMLTFGFLLCTVCSLHAQTYSIDWYKIAGGGGTSTGAAYQVGGTIGQHDAGETMAGGQYSLTGGFWGFMAGVQTPGAPLLKIAYSGTSVVVSWPSPSTGLVLQQNSSVASQTGWLNFAGVVNDNGTTKTITNALPSGNLFFRLARP